MKALLETQLKNYFLKCLCRSQCKNLRRFSSGKLLLINLIAFANSARRMLSRGFLSCVWKQIEKADNVSLNKCSTLYIFDNA